MMKNVLTGEDALMSYRILIVEDEATLANLISYNLKQKGYEVEVEHDGAKALQLITSRPYHLVLLDLMLPSMNGIELCRKVRARNVSVPIIMLTAKSTEEEIIEGLNAGADDYITKPFSVGELMARVSAALRRTSEFVETASPSEENIYRFGDLEVNRNTYTAQLQGIQLDLRPKEFEILYYFIQKPGMVVSRDEMMDRIWGFDFMGDQRTIDVHVSSLRKKIEAVEGHQVVIESIRGVGYKLSSNTSR
jgi:two-component system alkaline phosphatase synthesis response regulator PhoP